MMTNIIPMAGRGSRFTQAGYVLPKPLIPISGQPMILRVIDSLPPADQWIFIVRQEHLDQYRIDSIIKSKIPTAMIIPINRDTDGQATTCMLAIDRLKPDDEILIAACDSGFLFDRAKFNDLKSRPDIDAIYWTFTQNELLTESPTSWGWTKIGKDQETIEEMSVKVPVSNDPYHDHAIVATFYFKRANDFKTAYDLMVKENYRVNHEFYVDSMPIFLNKLRKKSVIFDVDLYVGWGKPSDIDLYQQKEREYEKADENGKNEPENPWSRFFKTVIKK